MFYMAHSSEGTETMAVHNLKPSKGYSGCRITQTRCWPPLGKLLNEFQVVLLNTGTCPLSGMD